MAFENVLNLEYNGVTVRCSRLLSWDREPVFQGPDFLYTRHRIHMVGILHKDFRWVGGGEQPKMVDQDKTMLAALQTPRKSLKISLSGGQGADIPWIETKLDARHGPVIVAHRISNLLGLNAASFELVVEFNENRKQGKGKEPPPIILSNRWEMVEEIDRHFRRRIMVRGRAIFRRDQLVAEDGSYQPDQFRKWVLFPLIPGFRRAYKKVGAGPDGVELFYETIDEQTSVDIVAPDVADLAVTHRYVHTAKSLETIAMEVADATAKSAIRTGRQLAANARQASIDPIQSGGALTAVGIDTVTDIAEAAADAARLAYAALPRHVGVITVWVKGLPISRMESLWKSACNITKHRSDAIELVCPGLHSETLADFVNREVTIVTTHEAAPLLQNLKIGFTAWEGVVNGEGAPAIGESFFKDDITTANVVNTNHTHRLDAPGPTNRGQGQRTLAIAKALISDEDLPISGEAEKARSTGGTADFNPKTRKAL